jgi:hypothetical protein
MEKINLSPDQCTYYIVTGTTLDQLQIKINDIIAQGWNMERFIGGIGHDGKVFYQAILICPESDKAYQARKGD